jgi:hypothetical protein
MAQLDGDPVERIEQGAATSGSRSIEPSTPRSIHRPRDTSANLSAHMPEWIAVRILQGEPVATIHAPFDPATTDALVRAARRVRPDPPRSHVEPHFSIYVVLLAFNTEDHGLYVGLTGLTPEERFLNHKAGRKASRWVRRYGLGLLPALYRHLNPLDWEPAIKAEIELAEALAGIGIRVEQG